MKTTSLFCLVCFLSLSLNTINVKAKTIDYYKIPVIFVNKNEQEVKIELKQEVTPPVEVPVLINQQEEVKKVDFLVEKKSSDFLEPIAKAIPTTKVVLKEEIIPKEEVETEIYETGRLPEFPSPVLEDIKINTKENYTKEEVIELIKYYSAIYGGDENKFLRIAKCESGYNENAYNPVGPYTGVYQYLGSTWNANVKRLLKENPNAFDGETPNIRNGKHNVHLAIWMMQVHSQWAQWGCK